MNILVVDDNNDLRGLLAKALRDAGHDVLERPGVTRVDWDHPPDIAIIDYMLRSEVDGIDVARQMRSHWPDVPLVGWTAGDDRMVELFENEVDVVIRKPMAVDKLIRSIEAAAG